MAYLLIQILNLTDEVNTSETNTRQKNKAYHYDTYPFIPSQIRALSSFWMNLA